MVVAGLGFKRGVQPAEVERALDLALQNLGSNTAAVTCLAVPSRKAAEPAPAFVAKARGMELKLVPQEELEAAASRTVSRSIHALKAMNVPSVAEAAALAAAGPHARLLVPKIATESVTCALAEGDGTS
jgi:cobalt-precorrin 5A hydrolase